jgi:hypothetical protein
MRGRRFSDSICGVEEPEESRLSEQVAASLREVSARIRRLDVDDDTRAEVARRLLAVTNTAKRDLVVAARRLERLASDLDDVHGQSPEGADAAFSLRHKDDSGPG